MSIACLGSLVRPTRPHHVGSAKHVPHILRYSVREIGLLKDHGQVGLQGLAINQSVVFQMRDQQARKCAHCAQSLLDDGGVSHICLTHSLVTEFYAAKTIFTASKLETFSDQQQGGLFQ